MKGVPIPWINNKINELMKDRDFHHRRAVKTNSVHHWARYRSLKNLVNREIKSAKSKYYCDLINEAKGDSGKIWKAVNEASSRNVKSSSPQCIVTEGTRANMVNQSARLFTFCVLGQSECLKFEIYKQRSEKITPCSTPSVPFDIKLFTPKLTNSDKACFLL